MDWRLRIVKQQKHPNKRRLEMPDTYVILFLVLVATAIATYFVPAGAFEREQVDGRVGASASVAWDTFIIHVDFGSK